jgi:hypothetical protein
MKMRDKPMKAASNTLTAYGAESGTVCCNPVGAFVVSVFGPEAKS